MYERVKDRDIFRPHDDEQQYSEVCYLCRPPVIPQEDKANTLGKKYPELVAQIIRESSVPSQRRTPSKESLIPPKGYSVITTGELKHPKYLKGKGIPLWFKNPEPETKYQKLIKKAKSLATLKAGYLHYFTTFLKSIYYKFK